MRRGTDRGLWMAALLLPFGAGAQITVDNTQTPEQLVQNVLLGGGITVSNVTFNGQPGNVINDQIGSFDGTNSNVNIAQGLVMCSGSIDEVVGPNNNDGLTLGPASPDFTGDIDLETISQQNVNDKAVLEFDFVPAGDSLKFRFVFGSEEYNEYVCSTFNDVFGFFLSGPGINGPFSNNAENIALIPGTTVPIGINTVNNGSAGSFGDPANCAAVDPNWQSNSGFYFDNAGGLTVQYDGFTVVLTARALVQCGQTYHIKLAIADAFDSALDSGVFLEGGSFSSNPFIPTLQPGPGVFGDVVFESCFPVTLNFVRVGDISQPDTVYLSYGGTSTPGVDYFPPLPDTLLFAGGQGSIPFLLNVPVDGDGDETIEITLLVPGGCNGQPIEVTYTFFIQSVPELQVTTSGATVACGETVDLTATVTGGFGFHDLLWSTGDTSATISVTAFAAQDITVIATDTCGLAPDTAFATITLTPPPPIALSIVGPDDLVEGCDSTVVRVTRPQGSTGDLTVQLVQSGTATNGTDHSTVPALITIPNGSNQFDLPLNALNDGVADGAETATITATYTNACGQTVTASASLTIADPQPLVLLGDDVVAECTDSLVLVVAASGGTGNIALVWGDGTTGSTFWVPGDVDGTYPVTAIDACGQTASLALVVEVDCEILIPNVFSPNGDGQNDRFVIEGIRSRDNTVRIFNRWGQVVFEANNYRNNWDGQNVPDGTYFYEVLVEGGEGPFTGHLTILNN